MKKAVWRKLALSLGLMLGIAGVSFALYRLSLPEPAEPEKASQDTVAIDPALRAKLQILAEAVRANPSADSLVLEYANALFDAGDYIQAAHWYAYYLEHFDSLNTDVRTDYAYTLLQTGKPMEGVSQLRRVLQIDSTHSIALYNFAVLHAQIGQLDSAKQYLKRAIRYASDSTIVAEAQRFLSQLEQLSAEQKRTQ